MSQTEPQFIETDRVHTLEIDTVGELARFGVSAGHRYSSPATVELGIDGDAPAAYSVQFGAQDVTDGSTIHWFDVPDDFSYTSTTTVEDAWIQSRRYLRIMIDEAATAGSQARVVVAYGQ